jgi:hypothetical protein
MTTRSIQSFDSLTSLSIALPALPERLAERIRTTEDRYATLTTLYNDRVTAVKQAASAALERIDHLRFVIAHNADFLHRHSAFRQMFADKGNIRVLRLAGQNFIADD